MLDYTTSGVLAAVSLEGTVADSVTLQEVGGTGTVTVTSTRYQGATARGLLEFSPTDPTACNTPGGVNSAGIGGFVGLGNS